MSYEATKSNMTRRWTSREFEVFNDALEAAALTCEQVADEAAVRRRAPAHQTQPL